MISSYNRIAGQSGERLAALSDGIFGVAMTLLAIDLRVPARELIHHERDLRQALVAISPEVLLSFLALRIFWVGQQSQLNHLRRSDIRLTWIHLAFLFAVTLMPFSTKLLGGTTPIAPPYSSTGATSSSLAPCFTPAGVTPPAPASSRTTCLPKC